MACIKESKLGVDYLTVKSSFGSIRGFVDKAYPNVAQFLGIPFAEPPTGPRRWLPPVAKGPIDNLDTTRFGPLVSAMKAVDCDLTAREEAKLPVTVWITGGAFLVRGSTVPYQNLTPWIETSQRHIVVSINYRLTIFGFPNPAGLAPRERNLGLLDQRLGLEYVHKHHPDNPLVRNQIMDSRGGTPRLSSTKLLFLLSSPPLRHPDFSPATPFDDEDPAIIGTLEDEGNAVAPSRSAHAPTFRFLIRDPAPAGTSSSELPLIFGTHSWFRGPSTALEEKISRAWQELYVVFAEEGPDGLRRLGWEESSKGKWIIIGSGERGWESVYINGDL
ncbi:para-nitrobenzyl esterase [Biscogniauxia mediterranea]|nr:para-nitrobenzyl esterase [Biscogniauxia mediterranea]